MRQWRGTKPTKMRHIRENRSPLLATGANQENHEEIGRRREDDIGEAPIVFSKACELFIEELTKRAWLMALQGKRRTMQKEDVASAVITTDIFDFLVNIVSDSAEESNSQLVVSGAE
ncbi:hypothetical protein DH2020_028758 [Rehmannia glutinosa]|uniref:Core Histone H2A/H2B/H3 domain-containing protein n=1 Tax=Rehmannia glutinosa TaxID=99300 RepID=A0ABR0VT75_REHGL